jgi:hypothetical protein
MDIDQSNLILTQDINMHTLHRKYLFKGNDQRADGGELLSWCETKLSLTEFVLSLKWNRVGRGGGGEEEERKKEKEEKGEEKQEKMEVAIIMQMYAHD